MAEKKDTTSKKVETPKTKVKANGSEQSYTKTTMIKKSTKK